MNAKQVQARNEELHKAEFQLRATVETLMSNLDGHQNHEMTKNQMLQLLQDRITELFSHIGVYRY